MDNFPPGLAHEVPGWVILIYLLAKDLIASWRSRQSQGERIGELRRDFDELAGDMNVKLRRRHRGEAP